MKKIKFNVPTKLTFVRLILSLIIIILLIFPFYKFYPNTPFFSPSILPISYFLNKFNVILQPPIVLYFFQYLIYNFYVLLRCIWVLYTIDTYS